MDKKGHSPLNLLKAAVAMCGSVVFLIVTVVVAWQATRYSISGQPMPNGKGGFMTPDDGYLLALIFLLFSVVWFIAARKFWRSDSV
jgi:hypothetical protein